VEGLFKGRAEPCEGAVDQAVERLIEMAAGDDGDGKDGGELAEFLGAAGHEGHHPVFDEVAGAVNSDDHADLHAARRPHRRGAEDDGEKDHVPGLFAVEVVACGDQANAEGAVGKSEIEDEGRERHAGWVSAIASGHRSRGRR
jgi:hypothetical protein